MGPIACPHQPPGLWIPGMTLQAEALTHSWSPQPPPGFSVGIRPLKNHALHGSCAVSILCLLTRSGLRASGGPGSWSVYCLLAVDVGSCHNGLNGLEVSSCLGQRLVSSRPCKSTVGLRLSWPPCGRHVWGWVGSTLAGLCSAGQLLGWWCLGRRVLAWSGVRFQLS